VPLLRRVPGHLRVSGQLRHGADYHWTARSAYVRRLVDQRLSSYKRSTRVFVDPTEGVEPSRPMHSEYAIGVSASHPPSRHRLTPSKIGRCISSPEASADAIPVSAPGQITPRPSAHGAPWFRSTIPPTGHRDREFALTRRCASSCPTDRRAFCRGVSVHSPHAAVGRSAENHDFADRGVT